MSAIVGFVHRDGRPAERPALEPMCRTLDHRALAGWTLSCEGSVALAAANAGHAPQYPFASSEGHPTEPKVIAAADARLDNRDELVHELGLPDSHPPNETLLIALHRRWGMGLVERLLGDFAFAIWNKNERSLLCARDPFGARPLYYYASDDLFAFASEIKALLALSSIPRELDEVQIGFHLDRFTDDPERTIYRGIRRLPAAHRLTLGQDGIRTDRYWSIDTEAEVRCESDGEYEEGFREHFSRAVRVRLPESTPVGSALSGGLDSSSIVCMARQLLGGQPLHTISCVFPGLPERERTWNDETPYIAEVEALAGIVPHRIRGDLLSPLLNLGVSQVWHDGPNLGFNMYLHHAMYDCARSLGVGVLMDGLDGDTAVSHGLDALSSLARGKEWAVLAEELRLLSERHGVPAKRYLDPWVYPPLENLVRTRQWGSLIRAVDQIAPRLDQARSALLLRTIRRAMTGRGRRTSSGGRESMIDPEFARRMELKERESALLATPFRRGDLARVLHARAIESPLFQYFLEVASNAASNHGIDPRYPFLDRRLVEYCVALPSRQKLRDGWTRSILRRSMAGILPEKVQWRVRKSRLVYNFLRTLRERDSQMVESLLFEAPTVLAPYVRMESVRELYDRFVEAKPTRGHIEDGLNIYQIASLSSWLHRTQSPSAPA